MKAEVEDLFAGIDISDEAAVKLRMMELAAAEFDGDEPEVEDREAADRAFRERKAAYVAGLRARGIDVDDPELTRRTIERTVQERLKNRHLWSRSDVRA